MSTDFFDDDLLRADSTRDGDTDEAGEVPVRPISEVGLGRMAKQKQETSNQMAVAAKEIQSLQTKREALEKEKSDLAEFTRKQEEYESGKREMIEKLDRSVILLGKEETRATRMAELLSVMRTRFRDSLAELGAIDEETWPEKDFDVELNKALVLVEDARAVYRKALAQVDAAGWDKGVAAEPGAAVSESAARSLGLRAGFGYWLKTGMALALPLMCFLLLLYLAHLVLTGTL